MTEISLETDEKTLFEYYSEVVPRKGEFMVIEVEENVGKFEIVDVIHHVFKNENKIKNYVECKLKELLPK